MLRREIRYCLRLGNSHQGDRCWLSSNVREPWNPRAVARRCFPFLRYVQGQGPEKSYVTSKSHLRSLPLQACRSPKAQQTAYLLLALYREVASLYHSRNTTLHPKREVSSTTLQGFVSAISSLRGISELKSQTQIRLIILYDRGF